MYAPIFLFSFLSSASSVIAKIILAFPASALFIKHRINNRLARNMRSLIDHFSSRCPVLENTGNWNKAIERPADSRLISKF